MKITEYERREWSRLARDAYKNGRNDYGHRFSAAATRKDIPGPEYNALQRIYARWLALGWTELPERLTNPRRRRPAHTAKFDRCVAEVGPSARNPYAVCERELGASGRLASSRRTTRRAKNPRRPAPAYYTITAYKARRVNGDRAIRELYFKGDRFARGAAGVVKFPTRELAAKFARYLAREHFGRLRGWRLRVA